MPKRICPLEWHLLPQLKRHVSEKDVNCGVLSSLHMGLVHEKTIALLFKGANRSGCDKNCPPAESPQLFIQQNESKSTYKQMLLSSNCQLQRGYGEKLLSVPQHADEILSKCSFCDLSVSMTDGKQCSHCFEIFCDHCSLTVYSEKDDDVICMSCYR